MLGPAQTSESETSPPNLSPSSSSSSSRSPKAVIDTLCTHIASTTLTSDDIPHNHRPFMQSQDVANLKKVPPPVTRHSPPPPPYLSFAAAPYDGHPKELCKSDGIWGLPAAEEEEEECETPRGEEYKIPEPVTCPPAPKRSRRHRSERPACVVGKEAEEEEEEEFVDSSEVEEALKKMH